MRILLIHQNFPGQFRHVAQAWAKRPGWHVMAIGRDTCPGLPDLPELKLIRYTPHRKGHPDQHPYLRKMEEAVLYGQAVVRVLQDLKQQGFTPDAILAHPGWGETLYAKDVFPHAKLIHLCEWYYNTSGADVNFDPEFPSTLDDQLRIRTWNALHLLNLAQCDAAISPTQWQRQQHPALYQNKIHVAHEGIATESLGLDPQARIHLPASNEEHPAGPKVTLRAGDPVITYVARNLEPYRGFPSFMRALEIVQREHPTAQALIVGGDDVSYGKRPPRHSQSKQANHSSTSPNWREQLLKECRIDASRTHFLGRIPYALYKSVLQVSAAHVYLSYPFVLSWSMLEAMASGCLVIGSNTPPVREVIEDGVNGLLVDFFNPQDIARQVLHSLQEPRLSDPLRQAAQACAQRRFSIGQGLAAYEAMLPAKPEITPQTSAQDPALSLPPPTPPQV